MAIRYCKTMVLFIGPPFGNYISLPFTVSIKGSYTYDERPGLIGQILRTLRYSFEHHGWINKIGLRNKGIDYAMAHYNPKHIYSLAILNYDEIEALEAKVPKNANIELNVSCPNAEKHMVSDGIKRFLNGQRRWCIVKISPLCTMEEFAKYYDQGFRQFHCSNTMPTPRGGLSGPVLRANNLNLIREIKYKYPDVEIIGGGGIQSYGHMLQYRDSGAQHFAVSTLFFHPFRTGMFFANFYRSFLLNK